jgi:hypothetical protein
MKFPTTVPVDKPVEVWFDHAIVQETAQSYSKETVTHLEAKGSTIGEGPAFQKIQKAKIRQYSTLTAVVRRLVEEKRLSFTPCIKFPVISSLGYMNEDMDYVLKTVVNRFKLHQITQPPRADGVLPKYVRGRVKVQMRNSLAFALLRGNALSVSNQGVTGVVTPI